MNLNIIIIENNAHYRDSLETLFKGSPDFTLCASFGSAAAALDELAKIERNGHEPTWHMALVDIELPRMNGIEAIRRLKKQIPDLAVVMLSVFEEPATILEAITAGADGYLLKKTSAPELLSQLKAISTGGSPLTPAVARTLLSLLRENTPNGISGELLKPSSHTKLDLTGREHEVLQCLVKGYSYKKVAAELNISIDTVRTHIRGIYAKLQVHSEAEAVARAIREKIV